MVEDVRHSPSTPGRPPWSIRTSGRHVVQSRRGARRPEGKSRLKSRLRWQRLKKSNRKSGCRNQNFITDNVMHYCPGCSHGTVHKLITPRSSRRWDSNRTMGISYVGCSVLLQFHRHRLDRGGARTRPGHRFGGETPLAGVRWPSRTRATATCRRRWRVDPCTAARAAECRGGLHHNAIYGMTGGQMADDAAQDEDLDDPTAATRG